MLDLDALHKEAMALYHQGRLVEAEQKYREFLHNDPNNADVWSNLGVLYEAMGQSQKALAMISKGLEIGRSAIHQCRLGWVLERMGDISQAIQAYECAIAIDPHWMDAYKNLARLLFATGNVVKALTICRQAISVNSRDGYLYQLLGNLLLNQHQLDEAISAFSKANELKPSDPSILSNLGAAYEAKANYCQSRASFYQGLACYSQHNYQAAIIHFQNFIKLPKVDIAEEPIKRVYKCLAECFKKLQREEEAIEVYRECIQLYPHASEVYSILLETLRHNGRVQEAIAVATEGAKRLPNEAILIYANCLMFPLLYENSQEIDFFRNRFTRGLEYLIQQTSLDTPEARKQALKGIGGRTNFYLQYQGYNDLALQTRYGQFVHQVLAANYPELTKPLTMPRLGENGKIRIGYVSACMWNQTVGKLFLGWLRNCDRQRFEVYCYHLYNVNDNFTSQFKLYSDTFHQVNLRENEENSLKRVGDLIIADQLHVLVFLDIGMQVFISNLAGLRLAPVQCMTWGHPVTSGLPTMDYFLSSDLMEPENAADHYSERLVRLPNIGISYPKPAMPETKLNRAYFHLREDAILYLSCQSLYKYLPQYDYIFAEIARRVPKAQFAFISLASAPITEKFRKRLQLAFANVGLNSEDYCVILPKQSTVSYFNLNLVSDVFLDSFRWSGGNTTLEAVACDLPIVTCPGELMRSSHSYAILKMLGVTDTIARNEAEYIEIAVRLGVDRAWRSRIVNQMKQRHEYLYDDRTCVAGLEQFYEYAVQHHRSW